MVVNFKENVKIVCLYVFFVLKTKKCQYEKLSTFKIRVFIYGIGIPKSRKTRMKFNRKSHITLIILDDFFIKIYTYYVKLQFFHSKFYIKNICLCICPKSGSIIGYRAGYTLEHIPY